MQFKVELVHAKEGLEVWDPVSDMDNADGVLNETELNSLVQELIEEFGKEAVEPFFNTIDDRLFVKSNGEVLLEYKIAIIEDPLRYLFHKMEKTKAEFQSCIWQDSEGSFEDDDIFDGDFVEK